MTKFLLIAIALLLLLIAIMLYGLSIQLGELIRRLGLIGPILARLHDRMEVLTQTEYMHKK